MSETPEPVTPIRPTSASTPDTPEATTTASVRRPHRPLAALWTLAVAVVAVDQLTKVWAVAALSDGHRVRVLGDWLTLTLLRNPGAAFSFATGQTWIFALIAIIVTVVVIRISRRLGSMWWAVALGLVLGGAVGNLIDRLVRAPGVLRGHVVDFIDYGGWFVGNVADIAIVGAAVIIMVLSLRGRELDGSSAGEGRGRHAETDA
ncbi:MAG: signal peptidase II [Actinomyces succiniciruminis]|nr:signal peptidase II [Actinomyces succiniciruminis]